MLQTKAFFHILISFQLVHHIHWIFGIGLLAQEVGLPGTAYLCIQPLCTFLLVQMTSSPKHAYFMALAFLASHELTGPMWRLEEEIFIVRSRMDHHRYILASEYFSLGIATCMPTSFFAATCFVWTNLRCLSFSVDRMKDEALPKPTRIFEDVTRFLGYVFYLPTMMTGPIITYQTFHCGVSEKNGGQ